jgi:hypothetical protein
MNGAFYLFPMAVSIDTLRINRRYTLINFGEITHFELIRILDPSEYIIKDLNSLEVYNLKSLTEYGKGKDYDLFELEEE